MNEEEWEDEGWEEDAWEDSEGDCDYAVTEFCTDPSCKENGLCTTECRDYLDSLKREKEDKAKKATVTVKP